MSQAPFVVQDDLTALTLAYRNERFIADQVLPRVDVDSDTFKYSKYTVEDAFTIPDSRVGRKSRPNQIDWTASEQSGSTKDYALDDPIPQADIQRAAAAAATHGRQAIDPRMRSTELLSDLIALGREKRVADLVFTAANYPTGNKATLSGATQWSHADSDPIRAMLEAMDGQLVRPNVIVMGQAVWTKVRLHPRVTAALFPSGGNAATAGTPAMRQALAELLEVDEILVGAARYNSAKPGQTASLSRLWGSACAMLYRAPIQTGPQGGVTFGFTAQFGDRIAGTIEDDPNIGMRGGTTVRVGEAVGELICASDCGYLFSAAIA